MAKIIKNPIEVKLVFDHQRKGIQISLTPTQETQIKNFARDVIYPQILTNEGIS